MMGHWFWCPVCNPWRKRARNKRIMQAREEGHAVWVANLNRATVTKARDS